MIDISSHDELALAALYIVSYTVSYRTTYTVCELVAVK